MLEVGAGLGVLTTFLADRVETVHAVELDRGLEPHLRERLGDRRNVELVFGDALRLPLDQLDPPAKKLVANLPYQIATPLVAESLGGLPTVRLWSVMVQREVADRFFAAAGTEELRRRLGARPAHGGADRAAPGRTDVLRAAAERGLRARRLPAHA